MHAGDTSITHLLVGVYSGWIGVLEIAYRATGRCPVVPRVGLEPRLLARDARFVHPHVPDRIPLSMSRGLRGTPVRRISCYACWRHEYYPPARRCLQW
jgi:hypothetical protein